MEKLIVRYLIVSILFLVTGQIVSVTKNGYLQVEDQDNRIHEFSFKEIDFI